MHLPRFEVGDVGSNVPELGRQLKWYSSRPRAWSVMNLWVRLLVGEVLTKPPSHAGDGAVEPMLAMTWCCYRIMLAIALPSLASDGAAKSCWWWHCRGDVGRGVMSLPCHAGDDIAEATFTVVWCRYRVMLAMALPRRRYLWHDAVAESYWRSLL
jgi:hypothetical protein